MKKILLAFLAGTITLSACQKDVLTLTKSTSLCQQTAVVFDYFNGHKKVHSQTDFTYNNEHKLTRSGSDYSFEWSAKQMVMWSFTDSAVQYQSTYLLDDFGRAVCQTTTDSAGVYDHNETFEYDTAGYLIKVIRSGNAASVKTKEWIHGNMVKEVTTSQSGEVRTITYSYDPNLVYPDSYIRVPIMGKHHKNLFVKSEAIDSSGTSSTIYQFELDSHGNVVKQIEKWVKPEKSIIFTLRYTYEVSK
jgi:hypothetical protein